MPKEIIKKIIKRSGEIADFDKSKIVKAIFRTTVAVDRENKALAEKLASLVVEEIGEKFHARSIPAIEEVQDIIEKVIIKNAHTKIAKSYILYRDQHRQLREIHNTDVEEKLMNDYLGKNDWRLKENSNMSFSVQGLNNYISSAVSAKYWLNKLWNIARFVLIIRISVNYNIRPLLQTFRESSHKPFG